MANYCKSHIDTVRALLTYLALYSLVCTLANTPERVHKALSFRVPDFPFCGLTVAAHFSSKFLLASSPYHVMKQQKTTNIRNHQKHRLGRSSEQ